jgi:hypothetical protein
MSADRLGEQMLRRAERLNDAFGFVLALVVASLVLDALLPSQVWEAVLISVSVSTSIFAMTGSRARKVLVRSALWLGLAAIALAAIAAVSAERFWLDVCALVQVVLVTGGRWRCCTGSSPPPRSGRGRSSERSASMPCWGFSSPTYTWR